MNLKLPVGCPVAPVTFLGIQPGYGKFEAMPLFNLASAIPGYPRGSTVVATTLEKAGYVIPTSEATKAKQAVRDYLERNAHGKAVVL